MVTCCFNQKWPPANMVRTVFHQTNPVLGNERYELSANLTALDLKCKYGRVLKKSGGVTWVSAVFPSRCGFLSGQWCWEIRESKNNALQENIIARFQLKSPRLAIISELQEQSDDEEMKAQYNDSRTSTQTSSCYCWSDTLPHGAFMSAVWMYLTRSSRKEIGVRFLRLYMIYFGSLSGLSTRELVILLNMLVILLNIHNFWCYRSRRFIIPIYRY